MTSHFVVEGLICGSTLRCCSGLRHELTSEYGPGIVVHDDIGVLIIQALSECMRCVVVCNPWDDRPCRYVFVGGLCGDLV